MKFQQQPAVVLLLRIRVRVTVGPRTEEVVARCTEVAAAQYMEAVAQESLYMEAEAEAEVGSTMEAEVGVSWVAEAEANLAAAGGN